MTMKSRGYSVVLLFLGAFGIASICLAASDPCATGRVSVEIHRVDDDVQTPVNATVPRRDVRALPVPVLDGRTVRLFSWADSASRSRTAVLSPNDYRQIRVSYVADRTGVRRACRIEEMQRGGRRADRVSAILRDAMGRIVEVRSPFTNDTSHSLHDLVGLRCIRYAAGDVVSEYVERVVEKSSATCSADDLRGATLGLTDRRQRYMHQPEGWLQRSITETAGADLVVVYEPKGSPRGTWIRLPKENPYPDAAAFGGWIYAIDRAQVARPLAFMDRVEVVTGANLPIQFSSVEAGSAWQIFRVKATEWSAASERARQDKFGMSYARFHADQIETIVAEGRLDSLGRVTASEVQRARVWELLHADSARLVFQYDGRQHELIALASPDRWAACVDPRNISLKGCVSS